MAFGAIVVLFLSALDLFTFTDSCINKLVGTEVTIKLDYPGWTESTDLKWKKNNNEIIYSANKKNNNVTVNKGSIVFKNVTVNDTGTYSFEIFNKNGQQDKTGKYELCVLEKVPKPNLNYTCQNTTATLKCDVQGDKGLVYSWNKNGNMIPEKKEKQFNFSTKAEKGVGRYTCTASNTVHSNTSDSVQVSCPTEESLLFGFNKWLMIGILAGGGFLVLLLIIVLVACSIKNCHRQEKRRQELDELRLINLNGSSTSDQHKIKQSARGQPAPPIPQDEVPGHQTDQGCVKPQARSRPPPPPVDDDEDPPPLPQPRKKPHRKNNNSPVPYI